MKTENTKAVSSLTKERVVVRLAQVYGYRKAAEIHHALSCGGVLCDSIKQMIRDALRSDASALA